ncbi:protein FAM111A-like [Dendronephthya gigantea]|uniref:protein FAM111A-like n=1 Tax=Dendronephthya gigantea TaxID=151771 RepID=UPI00106B3EA4|nr:protein FAM111A-like [Dendronephthya gigantea]
MVSQSATLKGAFRKNLLEKECQNFVHEDGSILNLTSSHLQKNKSTKIPAILLERFGHYIKSIGRIACGKVVGTCFLVTDELVITNHHVYDNIKRERCQPQNENLPIIISFDYYYPGQTENFVDVEVDEAQDPQIESKEVDYKLLRMKKDKRLENRDQLGALIRGRPLQERQIVIIGHPEGKQLHHETCVVVSDHSISETLNQRYKMISGDPVSDQKSKEFYEEYKESLSYDTSLFSGASGSPIFDMDGYIVAMHSKGHTLKNLADGKTYSLMEFAVPFDMICKDLERTKDENFVKEIFPHYDLDLREVPMDH